MLVSLCLAAILAPLRAPNPAPLRVPGLAPGLAPGRAATSAPDLQSQDDAAKGTPLEDHAEAKARFLAAIEAKEGPFVGDLGTMAEIDVPEGFAFAGAKGTQRFLEMNENTTSGNEVGLLFPWREGAGTWFVCFTFRDTGYIKDDEKNALDADKLLANLREGTQAGNEERKKRGWDPLEIVGWTKPPFYDPTTHDLTWATRLRSPKNETVNWSTRLLGRRGTMNVDLVVDPAALDASLPGFQAALKGFRFKAGNRYAEYRAGDRVAEYGLGALVLGGAGAVAAKTGLLAKFWKAIVLGAAAVAGAVKRFWAKIAGSRTDKRTEIQGGG